MGGEPSHATKKADLQLARVKYHLKTRYANYVMEERRNAILRRSPPPSSVEEEPPQKRIKISEDGAENWRRLMTTENSESIYDTGVEKNAAFEPVGGNVSESTTTGRSATL